MPIFILLLVLVFIGLMWRAKPEPDSAESYGVKQRLQYAQRRFRQGLLGLALLLIGLVWLLWYLKFYT